MSDQTESLGMSNEPSTEKLMHGVDLIEESIALNAQRGKLLLELRRAIITKIATREINP